MASVNVYQKFDFTDDDGNLYSDGSTSTAKTVGVSGDEIYDRTFKVLSTASTATVLWNDDHTTNFDFLWIESDKGGEVQLVCNEGGTTGASNLVNAWVVKLNAGVPFILSNNQSRNRAGLADGTDINSWETNWTLDTIDRIEFFNNASDSKVRIVAIT
jgi:hypothetical protein